MADKVFSKIQELKTIRYTPIAEKNKPTPSLDAIKNKGVQLI